VTNYGTMTVYGYLETEGGAYGATNPYGAINTVSGGELDVYGTVWDDAGSDVTVDAYSTVVIEDGGTITSYATVTSYSPGSYVNYTFA
jgi:hypothetical protein